MADPRFRQAEQHYHSLKGKRDVGQLSDEAFERALWDSMFESDGRWWMLGANTGQWYASDGDDWIERQPPDRGAAPELKGATTSVAPAAPTASATEASDRSLAAQVFRVLVLGCVAVFATFCISTGYEAWIHGDRPGGVIAMGFGLLLLAAIVSAGRRRSRH